MYIPENSTLTTKVSWSNEYESLSRAHSDLYILFAFMGFIVGAFVLFFTFNISKARLAARKSTSAHVIDMPPRYSEVVPPSYEWAVQHHCTKDFSQKEGYTVSDLSTMVVICSCLLALLQYGF